MDLEKLPAPEVDILATINARSATSFNFEEEKLAQAFAELPLKRQLIMEMMFVEKKTPSEIAKELNCTEAYVYNQKHRALVNLRIAISKKWKR